MSEKEKKSSVARKRKAEKIGSKEAHRKPNYSK
jgi:hypothetical protein